MSSISDNLQAVLADLQAAARAAGRDPAEIRLLAVSKTFGIEAIVDAVQAGQRCFGENYVQEALLKIQQAATLMPAQPLEWHFIGPIQSNKTRQIATHFDWVHSVDRLKIAQRLSEQRPAGLPTLQVCLQVNISAEASKSGVLPADSVELACAIQALPNLCLRGLMAVPEASEDVVRQRQAFQAVRALKDDIARALQTRFGTAQQFDTLSMGMSGDMWAAIAEGSTMVRIGSNIFGKRHYAMQSSLKLASKVVSKLAIIGGGNMAAALINGLCAAHQQIDEILVIDTQASTLDALQQRFGTQITLRTSTQIDAQLVQYDAIILAVKPQQLSVVAQQLAPFCAQQLVLSIAAGIRASDLARWLGGYQKIVRSMPNTPAMIGRGVTGLFALPEVSASQRNLAENLLRAVGEIIWLDEESLLDAVTAVSGSGPAYVFYFIEAMQQAAIDLGLTAEQAKILSLATFQGAAQLAAESSEAIHVLRERVTSKGGTTYAALSSMEQHQVKAAIMTAIQAAATRGKQLGDELGQSA